MEKATNFETSDNCHLDCLLVLCRLRTAVELPQPSSDRPLLEEDISIDAACISAGVVIGKAFFPHHLLFFLGLFQLLLILLDRGLPRLTDRNVNVEVVIPVLQPDVPCLLFQHKQKVWRHTHTGKPQVSALDCTRRGAIRNTQARRRGVNVYGHEFGLHSFLIPRGCLERPTVDCIELRLPPLPLLIRHAPVEKKTLRCIREHKEVCALFTFEEEQLNTCGDGMLDSPRLVNGCFVSDGQQVLCCLLQGRAPGHFRHQMWKVDEEVAIPLLNPLVRRLEQDEIQPCWHHGSSRGAVFWHGRHKCQRQVVPVLSALEQRARSPGNGFRLRSGWIERRGGRRPLFLRIAQAPV
mmetsp:Transcript_19563/g.47349  ORF Transcript_19563/g.47349 Transcript_19563/m.47349 type:complete len:351 (-) Transcript_19563:222-1274(-)